VPTHLLHSGNEQAIIFLSAIAVAVIIKFWRIVLTGFTLMLIVAALIVFSVILDLHVVHEVATYVRNLVHSITGLTTCLESEGPDRSHGPVTDPKGHFLDRSRGPYPAGVMPAGYGLPLLTASLQRHGSAARWPPGG
jgi:hypothetical protein